MSKLVPRLIALRSRDLVTSPAHNKTLAHGLTGTQHNVRVEALIGEGGYASIYKVSSKRSRMTVNCDPG